MSERRNMGIVLVLIGLEACVVLAKNLILHSGKIKFRPTRLWRFTAMFEWNRANNVLEFSIY